MDGKQSALGQEVYWRLAQTYLDSASRLLRRANQGGSEYLSQYRQLIRAAIATLLGALQGREGLISPVKEAQTRYALALVLYEHTTNIQEAERQTRRSLALLESVEGQHVLWQTKRRVLFFLARLQQSCEQTREAGETLKILGREAEG